MLRVIVRDLVVLGALGLAACGSPAAPAAAHLSASTLDLPPTLCGTTQATRVELDNPGGSPLHWDALVEELPGATITPPSGTLEPGAHVTLEVSVPSPMDKGLVDLRGRLVVRSAAPESALLEVPISMRTTGAVLRFTKLTRDFGAFPVGFATPPLDVSLTNVGDAAGGVDLSVAPPFSLEWTETGPIPPGATRTGRARFTPAALGTASAIWSANPGGGLCEVPTMLALGRGVEGVVGVTPGALDFGDLDCNSTATASVFVSNVSATPFEVTVALRPNSRYEPLVVIDTAPPGGVLEVPVKVYVPSYGGASPVPYDDVLRIRTDAPKDQVHDVPLATRPRGAELRFDGATVDLGVFRLDQAPSTRSFTVHNDGNVPVTIGLQTTTPFAVPASVTVPPQGSAVVPVQVGDSWSLESVSRALSIAAPPLCAQAPAVALAVRYADRATKIATGRGGLRVAIAESGHVYSFYKGGTPSRMAGLSGQAVEVIGYDKSACARLVTGGVKCWGAGTLGNGSNVGSASPVDVLGITNAISLGASGSSACAVLATGKVRCWGGNISCLFGTCAAAGVDHPVEVFGLSGVLQVAPASGRHCALLVGGAVTCWGPGFLGAIDPPTPVAGLPPAVFVAAGFERQCALDQSGQAWCWGERPGVGTGAPPTVMSGASSVDKIVCAEGEALLGQSATWAKGPQVLMGWNVSPVVMPTTFPMPLRDMSAMAGLCVVRADGRMACTNDNGFQNPPPLVDVPGFD